MKLLKVATYVAIGVFSVASVVVITPVIGIGAAIGSVSMLTGIAVTMTETMSRARVEFTESTESVCNVAPTVILRTTAFNAMTVLWGSVVAELTTGLAGAAAIAAFPIVSTVVLATIVVSSVVGLAVIIVIAVRKE